MNSLELEAGKMELIRTIVNINSGATLSAVKELLKDYLKKNPTTSVSKKHLTEYMIKKYSGSWEDNRSADEIVKDIYSNRISHIDMNISPFDA
jgi:hypothetical protein